MSPHSPSEPYSRQLLIPHFDQRALASVTAVVVGLGAQSILTRWLARTGWSHLKLVDPDTVAVSNWSRQDFPRAAYTADASPYKVHALAETLIADAAGPLTVEAHPFTLQDVVDAGIELSADVALVLIDSDPGRIFAARYFRQQRTPVVFAGFANRAADCGYVFVQDRDDAACLACAFPAILANPTDHPCGPQSAELPLLLGGLILYAATTLVMPERPRDWNRRIVGLGTGTLDSAALLTPRAGCPLCSAR